MTKIFIVVSRQGVGLSQLRQWNGTLSTAPGSGTLSIVPVEWYSLNYARGWDSLNYASGMNWIWKKVSANERLPNYNFLISGALFVGRNLCLRYSR